MDQYEELGCIGEGTYGVVIKCRHRETGQLVAIKQFKESDDDEQVRKTVEREVRVLKALAHVNIVSLLDVFQARGRVCLVFEYVERTVLDCLKLQPRGLGDAATRRIMWQLVTAVKYLHSQKVPLMHRDIKPENMLVSGEGLLKLCDFGFARPCVGAGARAELSDYVATRWYRSPELLVGDRSYGPAVDVWAIGCMAVEMHTGDPLFPGESDVDQLWLILKGMGSLTPGHTHLLSKNPYFTGMRQPAAWEMEPLEVRYRKFDLPLLQFLKACLHPNPEKRASCSELLRLPYLANVEASFSDDFLAAEAEARERLEQRAAAAKLRKHKRKSADLEPPQQSATFSITASAHVSIPDAPRYRPAPPLRLEPQEEAEAPQMTRPESPRAEARCAPVAQAASPDSRASVQSTQHPLLQRWASGSLAGHSQTQPSQEQSSRFRAQHLAWQNAAPSYAEPAPRPQPAGPAHLFAQLPLSSAAAQQLQWHLASSGASMQSAAMPVSIASVSSWHSGHDQPSGMHVAPLDTQNSGALPSLHRRTAHTSAAEGVQQEPQGASGLESRYSVTDWHPSMAGDAARSDYSRGRIQPTASSGLTAVSECMSISPERRQTAMPAAGSTPASRDGRPSRQQRFMADMRATVPLEVPEQQQSKRSPAELPQDSVQPLLPTKQGPLLPGKHFFGAGSGPKDGMIPAVYGSASTMQQMVVCSMPQLAAAQPCHPQLASKASPQKLQPTRRLQGRQQPPLLTQFSSTDVGVPAACSSPPEPPSSGPAPMELMSPAGHGGCRSPAHKLAAAAEPAPRAGRGVGHGYPLCVSGVQSTLFRATPPRKQAGAGRGESPQPCPDAAAAQQPALRRSRRKPVATRLF